MPLEDLVVIGKISKPQGLRGEVRLWSDSISGEVFRELKKVIVENPLGGEKAFYINRSQPHKDFIKVKFRGVDTREQAEGLRNWVVKVPKNSLPALPDGTFYDFDLIGLQVLTNSGILLGRLKEVWRLPANDVYVVQNNEGKEYLIPVIKDVILEVNLESKKMIIFPLEGLLDI